MAKKVNKYDIRKNGPLSYRALQTENASDYTPDDSPFANLQAPRAYTPQIYNVYEGSEMSPLQAQGNGDYWGKSQYDNPSANANEWEDLAETRYENQPWYDTLANGVAKMYGNFATTFLSSIIGIPYGIEEAIRQQRWSALWDNDVTQALGDADDWMEEHFTNYRSQKQQDSPWYDPSNLFSMNFIADDIIKNNGFMMGSVASMAVGSGEIGLLSKALGYVGDIGKIGKTTQNVVSSLFAATGEGMIEAKQGVRERNKAERLNVDNALTPQYNSLQMEDAEADEEYARTKGLDVRYDSAGRPMDMAYERYMQKKRDIQARRQELDNRKAAAYQQIEESGQEMGNTILLANQGLLTMGNLLQFSKGMTKSFDLARHAAQTSSKIAKPAFATVSRASKNLADGYKIGGSKAAGRLWAGTKGFLTEGAEEMNQQFIQGASGAAFNEGEVNDYWKARLDPDAYRSTTESLYDFGTILDRGFRDSWGSIDQWEQFLVGGLTGAMGSYMPTKLFNQDKSKKLYDPRRYGEWQGGAIKEVGEFNKQYNQLEENVKDLNDILGQQDFSARVQRLAAHAYHEGNKTQAAENNDKKWWKDEDDKQTIHDIQSFLRAGRLGDLRAIYDQIGSEWSDEDIEGLKKATTREVTADEDKKKFDDAKDEEIAEIAREQDALQEQLDVMREDGSSDAAMGDISSRITALEAEKARLNQEKDAYKGQRRFIGAFIGEDGEATMTNDEIREVMKHNSEALNAKIDSYLDSVAAVNEATGGNLSKDQEDNLAYLHNMGKEGIKRFDDIMAKNRKHLPKTFLLRTDKSPEQLAKEYAISDITFSKDDDTPEGYVKADTSLMDDKTFGNFFMREVIKGGSISPELGATPDGQYFRKKAKADKNLKDEEKIARHGEQYAMNMQNIADAFFESYMKENDASEMDAENAFKTLMQELADASSLLNSSGQYYKTLAEYMANPEKVEEAKEKEEKKNASKSAEKQAVDKFGGKSAKEINQDISEGKLTIEDVDDFIGTDLSDITDDDSKTTLETAKQEAQKSRDIRQKQAETKKGILDKAEEGGYSEASVDAALNAVDAMAANAEDVSGISLDDIADYISPEQVEGASVDMDEKEDLSQQVSNLVAEGLNYWKEGQDKKDDIPDASTAESFAEQDSTGHDSTTQMPSETAVPKTTPQKSDEWEQPLPVNRPTSGAISKMKEEVNGDNNTTSQNAPWRSTTRRYGRKQVAERKWSTTRVPYHELVSDKNSVLYKRSKAIWEYLNDDKVKAWDKVDTVGKDKLEAGKTVIHFMVKEFSNEIFGKPFEELSEKEKPQALVIFMLNDSGEVLADLPLAKFERGYDEDISKIKSPQLKELVLTQKMLFEAFENKRVQTGCSEAVADKTVNRAGAENLGLTFKTSHKPFVSKVSQILNGIVPFGNEINTLNDIIEDEDILLGISVTGETIATAKDKKKKSTAKPLSTANIGQAYILIPSPTGIPVPVPFYTKPFDAQTHSTTQLYRILGDALTNLVNSAGDKDTSSYKESIDVLEGLLQVRVQEGARRTVEVTKDNVTLHLQSLTNPEQKIDITVPNTGNTADIVSGIINKLSGTPINISLQFINSKIGVKNGVSAPYNKVIGEIADANLPKNTAHTVNNAFLIRLATDTTVKRTEVKYQQSGVQTRTIGDRTIQINTDNFTATEIDPVTKEEIPITGDEEVNLLLAETKAAQQADKTKSFKITLDGEVRTYDPVQRKFVKSSSGTGVNAGQASLNQQKEERKNGTISDPQLAAIFGPTERDEDDSTTIEDIVTNADNFEDLSREEKVQYMERAFKAQGDKKKDYQPHLDAFDAALGEDEANKHKPGYVSKAKSQFKSFWDLAELVFKRDKEAAGKKSEQSAEAQQQPTERKVKTIEEEGNKILQSLGYKIQDRHSNGHVRGGQSGWKVRFIIKNPKTGKPFTTAEYHENNHEDYYAAARPLLEFLKEYFKNPDGSTVITRYKESGPYEAHYMYKDSNGTREPFKFLSGGEIGDSDFTIYIGSMEDVQKFISDIKESPVYDLLAEGNTNRSDISFNEKIHGRIEGRNIGFSNYTLPKGLEKMFPDGTILYEDNVVEILILGGEYAIRDIKTQKLYRPGVRNNRDTTTAIGYVNNNIVEIRNKIAENVYGRYITGNISEKDSFTIIQQPTERRAKTIEEIEKEVREAGIINKRNKDAWDAISDSLKLKMVNEGTSIVLEYGGNEVALDYRDFEQMKNALKEANKYAKSGSLTVNEGPKYRRVTEAQKRADIQKERRWLQKNLPMFNTEDRLHFLQGLLQIPGEKNWAWGRFQKGIITLSDMAARGTLYHEAFHAVTQTLLSDDELNELYDAGRKQYNEESPALVEELLAEDFRRYIQQEETPIIGTIRKFFRKIMNAIRNLSGYRDPVQELFYRINNGEFKDSIPNEVRGDNAFYNRIRKDRLLPEDHPATIAIRRDFSKKNWKGKFSALGNQWTRFKNAWVAEGYTPVAEPRYNAYGNSSGYVFIGVRTNADEDISKRENRRRKNKERVQRTQAVIGVREKLSWDRLDPDVQMQLLDDITRESYESMSVDEQEQWVNCRG